MKKLTGLAKKLGTFAITTTIGIGLAGCGNSGIGVRYRIDEPTKTVYTDSKENLQGERYKELKQQGYKFKVHEKSEEDSNRVIPKDYYNIFD